MSTSGSFLLPTPPPYVPPPAPVGPGITYNPDHRGEAENLLISEFDDAAKLHGLVRALVGPLQEFEEHALSVRDAFDVDTATGKTLDMIGGLVGVYREQRSDVAYRAYIKARILTNASECNAKTIYAVARALLGEDPLSLELVPLYPAHYDLEVEASTLRFPWDLEDLVAAEPPDAVAHALADCLLLATSAGVSLTLFYQFADDEHTFTFSSSATLEEDSLTQGFADVDDEEDDGGAFIGVQDRF